MTPENQRDDETKGVVPSETDFEKARKLLPELAHEDSRCMLYMKMGDGRWTEYDPYSIEIKIAQTLAEQRQSWEREKAGLEERVRELEQNINDIDGPARDANAKVIEQLAEISRLKAENEDLLKRIGNLSTQAQSAKDNLKAYQNQLAISKRISDECSRLTSALAMAMEIIRKILKQCYLAPVDHACIECVPAGSSVVKGFLCGVHEGVKALSDPSGSLAFERWKKLQETSKITGETSDGYHTFNELYDHRVLLWINLCLVYPHTCYVVEEHYEGWFLLGMETPKGQISYHCPNKYLHLVGKIKRRHPEFDGHTSKDVIKRLELLALEALEAKGGVK